MEGQTSRARVSDIVAAAMMSENRESPRDFAL
jgi:hypothetical protein